MARSAPGATPTPEASAARVPSARREELLELAYAYVLEHGLTDVSLRPLASAVGSSPRVLLFLFDSKDGLVRALLERARRDELQAVERLRSQARPSDDGLAEIGAATWEWLADPRHRKVPILWVEAYARSLVEPDGPWGGFARATVDDWLAVLAAAQPPTVRRSARGRAARTALLAVLRGALLDLLATDDLRRTSAAVEAYLLEIRGTTAR